MQQAIKNRNNVNLENVYEDLKLCFKYFSVMWIANKVSTVSFCSPSKHSMPNQAWELEFKLNSQELIRIKEFQIFINAKKT